SAVMPLAKLRQVDLTPGLLEKKLRHLLATRFQPCCGLVAHAAYPTIPRLRAVTSTVPERVAAFRRPALLLPAVAGVRRGTEGRTARALRSRDSSSARLNSQASPARSRRPCGSFRGQLAHDWHEALFCLFCDVLTCQVIENIGRSGRARTCDPR